MGLAAALRPIPECARRCRMGLVAPLRPIQERAQRCRMARRPVRRRARRSKMRLPAILRAVRRPASRRRMPEQRRAQALRRHRECPRRRQVQQSEPNPSIRGVPDRPWCPNGSRCRQNRRQEQASPARQYRSARSTGLAPRLLLPDWVRSVPNLSRLVRVVPASRSNLRASNYRHAGPPACGILLSSPATR
jgi:hypothetical protein